MTFEDDPNHNGALEFLNSIKREFNVDSNGLISNPGKFEAEPISTAYFYDTMLNGEGECIEILPEDREILDNIPADMKYAHVIEDSQGFVTVEFTNDCEEDYNEEEEDY